MKSYLFATYESDKRKFKIRNRIILLLSISLMFFLLKSDSEEPLEEIIIPKEEVIEVKNIPVPTMEEIQAIINKGKTKTVTNSYYIQIGNILYLESFKKTLDKLDKENLNYELFPNGKYKKVLVGPYDGYSKAKEALSFIEDITGIKDAFVSKKEGV